MRFKLKFGQHIQANPSYDPKKEDAPDNLRQHTFNADGSGAGNVIETETDLIKLLGDNGKFVRLGDRKGTKPPRLAQPRPAAPTPGLPAEADDEEEIEDDGENDKECDDDEDDPAPASEASLSQMTVAQLKDYAADHEIDLKGVGTKSAILAAILAQH